MGNGSRVEVISSKGCSKLSVGFSSAMVSLQGFQMDPTTSPMVLSSGSQSGSRSNDATFSGLVIGVTGLSKVKLNESLYGVKSLRDEGSRVDELSRIVGFTGAENRYLPPSTHNPRKPDIPEESKPWYSERGNQRDLDSETLSGHTTYVDSDVSDDLRNKVTDIAIQGGTKVLSKWFPGCSATHVVCEGISVGRYLGCCSNLITVSVRKILHGSLWVLKTAKEKEVQRLVHLSAELARQLASYLHNRKISVTKKATKENGNVGCEKQSYSNKLSLEERQQIVELAKNGARDRRSRKMQLYLSDSDKANYFFSHKGFTCTRVRDHIYEFYLENISAAEKDYVTYTDSKPADQLGPMYTSEESAERGFIEFKRQQQQQCI